MLSALPEPAADPGRLRSRRLLVLLLAVALLALALAPAALAERSRPPGGGPEAATMAAPPVRRPVPPLLMPVAGAVVRGFEAPAGPYGPGHRGIDVAAPVGEVVRAPAAGRVTFAGGVAGTTWVTVLIAPEVLVTVGPLLQAEVVAGRPVRARGPVGRVAPGHGAAARAGRAGSGEVAAVHLGVRVEGVYVDPLAYLIDRPRPRLAPLLAPGGLAVPPR
jgi:murein DD-endopeptidase MepM/ murein hydrolase activator NlpD